MSDPVKKKNAWTIILIVLFIIAVAAALWGWLRPVIKSSTANAVAEEPTRDPLILQMATQLANLQQPTSDEVEEATVVSTPTPFDVSSGFGDVVEVFRAFDADYPALEKPDPVRQVSFPDVPFEDRPALVAYESPFEDGDFCDNTPCDVDVPQYYYRVMTAGQITIPDLGINCVATQEKGCAAIIINHFGPTVMYRENNIIDHGFTVAGRIWDMSSPDLVTLTAQALVDHYMYRMTQVEDGANCSTIDACKSVQWDVVIVGNDEKQIHWSGIFFRQ